MHIKGHPLRSVTTPRSWRSRSRDVGFTSVSTIQPITRVYLFHQASLRHGTPPSPSRPRITKCARVQVTTSSTEISFNFVDK
jgi:hypothetical protein